MQDIAILFCLLKLATGLVWINIKKVTGVLMWQAVDALMVKLEAELSLLVAKTLKLKLLCKGCRTALKTYKGILLKNLLAT